VGTGQLAGGRRLCHGQRKIHPPALARQFARRSAPPTAACAALPCSYIRRQHPYWNATGGSDHFYFALNDRGACTLNVTHSELWAPIKLVHFGAYSKNVSGELGITRFDMEDGSPVKVGSQLSQ
jgi:hypothetical protein